MPLSATHGPDMGASADLGWTPGGRAWYHGSYPLPSGTTTPFINFDTGGEFPLVGQGHVNEGRRRPPVRPRALIRTAERRWFKLPSEFATSINFAEEPGSHDEGCGGIPTLLERPSLSP